MPTILVVDDDRDIRDAVEAVLTAEGYEVMTARNGLDALAVARRARPSTIILDLMMPVMSGWEFLQVQRSDPMLASIPVVVMTAASAEKAAGVDVVLRKPFDLDALVAAVVAVTGRDGTGAVPAMS